MRLRLRSFTLKARVTPVKSYPGAAARMADLALRTRLRGRRPYVIAPGGSSALGCIGYVAAGMELAQQIDSGCMAEPDAIYVAIGSGATAVGLSMGMCAAGLQVPVIAVRATDRYMINRPRVICVGHRVPRKPHDVGLLRRKYTWALRDISPPQDRTISLGSCRVRRPHPILGPCTCGALARRIALRRDIAECSKLDVLDHQSRVGAVGLISDVYKGVTGVPRCGL